MSLHQRDVLRRRKSTIPASIVFAIVVMVVFGLTAFAVFRVHAEPSVANSSLELQRRYLLPRDGLLNPSVKKCTTRPAFSSVESLLKNNKWEEAARAIFLEAKSISPLEWTIPALLASSGFLKDALEAIADMHPNAQPRALLTLVDETSPISQEKKNELVQLALGTVRKRPSDSSNYLKSGEFAQVAIFYSRAGSDDKARTIFDEALKAAESGLSEKDSGGYRQITNAMVSAPSGNRDWMVSLTKEHFRRARPTTNTAFEYRDIAQVAVRLQRNELASELIDLGASAAKVISDDSVRRFAFESLASVAIEADYAKRLPEESPVTRAISTARTGDYQKAHAIVSGLSANFYIDRRLEAFKRLIDDAVKRQDLNAILYFAQNPVNQPPSAAANAWRQIAELQAKKGRQKDATSSYRQAVLAISDGMKRQRHFDEIEAAVALAESMRLNKFDTDARKAILDAAIMVDLIPERRAKDRIKANALLAGELWRFEMHLDAKERILQAYHAVKKYDDKANIEKSRLLSEIGKAVSTLAIGFHRADVSSGAVFTRENK